MAFTHQYTIRFSDTDAAGVVYFANVLNFCHEAYEESLTASGINLKQFFSNPEIAIPITHTTVDFYRPMYCGDKIGIELTPQQLDINRFEITYQITSPQSIISIATTKHICINPITRSKIELPQQISNWIQTTS
ncbi:acyl-CoA thioesterase [Calothrix sp. PCC 6303]|uniref:acyl-CoA thioesterase n=1 Tax=Calothrix sp. PCC 6303 TaxID=1170562 RepID=UPI0002A03E9D|nr:thioesterase family protein [Calothrix sp. PCC 6303]AFZ03382.1 thioesterase superfamily protein [Calothrix sp. PCC 6303]